MHYIDYARLNAARDLATEKVQAESGGPRPAKRPWRIQVWGSARMQIRRKATYLHQWCLLFDQKSEDLWTAGCSSRDPPR